MGHLSPGGEPDENGGVARARGGKIVLYERRGEVGLEVRLDGETLWLTLAQMAELFGRDKSVVSRHLANVFRSKELDRVSAVAENATTAADGKTYSVKYYNLDAILSVGYRVNSKEGTRFRIWATRTLREHVLKGFTLNERRLREKGLGEMEQAVSLHARTLDRHELVTDEGRAVLDVVERYTRAWRLLLQYDEKQLNETPSRPRRPSRRLELDDARSAIRELRGMVAVATARSGCSVTSVGSSSPQSWGTSSRRSVASRSIRACRRALPAGSAARSRSTTRIASLTAPRGRLPGARSASRCAVADP